MITRKLLMMAHHTLQLYRDEQIMIHGINHIMDCPFCGSECKIKTTTFGDSMKLNYQVECTKNKHSLDCWSDTEQEAIDIWNDRDYMHK